VISIAKKGAGHTVSIRKPFVFGIRDSGTGAWLFLGHVLDPSLP
jgi:serine protease inhibitor